MNPSVNGAEETGVKLKKKFRLPGLDGIRALACFAVLGYHLLPSSFMNGGFLGVDVFFVLSGFLITSLLLKEKSRTGFIDIGSFWIRRVRRLLPAVLLAGLVTSGLAALVSRDLLVGLGSQLEGLTTFTYNWVEIARGSSYFDVADPQLFTNVWSLAVEQQFYVVWPLVVMLLAIPTGRKRKVLGVIVTLLLASASAGWMWWLMRGATDPTRAYMGSDSHAFGLMIGAGLAFLMPKILAGATKLASSFWRYLRTFLGWLGFVGMIVGFYLVPDNSYLTYPFLVLIECFLVVLVIQSFSATVIEAGGFHRSLVWLLELKPLVWLGERSYGIYLWHWPLWVIMGKAFPFLPLFWQSAIVCVISVVAAAASYTLIETPMRVNGIFHTVRSWRHSLKERSTVLVATTALLACAVTGGFFYMLATAPKETSAQAVVRAGSTPSNFKMTGGKHGHGDTHKSFKQVEKPAPKEAAVNVVQPVGKNVTIIGDSVTLASENALKAAFPGAVVDGKVSRAFPSVFSLMKKYSAAGQMGTYLVVGLTTNSVLTQEQLTKLLDSLKSDQKLVLVTAFGSARISWIKPSNQVIRDFAAKHTDRVRVASWDEIISKHTENLAGDLIHPDGVGAGFYTSAIKDALASFPNVHDVGVAEKDKAKDSGSDNTKDSGSQDQGSK